MSHRPTTVLLGRPVRSVTLAANSNAVEKSGVAGRGSSVVVPSSATLVNPAAAVLPALDVEVDKSPETASAEEYARGVREGREEARRELAAALTTVHAAAQALQRESREMHRVMDRFVVKLALSIAAKIVGREVEAGEDVRRMIAQALAQVPRHERLRLRLHPQDVPLLEAYRNKSLDRGTMLPADTVLIADEAIHRGGCLIDSPMGQLDARVETQLHLLEAVLLAHDQAERG